MAIYRQSEDIAVFASRGGGTGRNGDVVYVTRRIAKDQAFHLYGDLQTCRHFCVPVFGLPDTMKESRRLTGGYQRQGN